MKPFLNTAVIGNGRILAGLGSNGELHRLFWPHIDMSQQINMTWPALLSPAFGERAVRLDDEGSWVYAQEYVGDTNILQTKATAKRGRLEAITLDFVVPDRDILVRCFTVTNRSETRQQVVFLYYSSFYLDESPLYNSTRYDSQNDIMLHYRRNTWIGVAGSQEAGDYQCGCCPDNGLSGNLQGNDIAMSPDGCQAWNLRVLEPGQSRTVAVFLVPGGSREQVTENVLFARSQGWEGLMKETGLFWETYLGRGYYPVGAGDEVERLLRLSVMVCKLVMNRATGGIIAAPEFDESYRRSGGYAYCWGRDAVFIAHAMLKAGYPEYARDFYRWAARYQNPQGDWPQRQYTNGSLAPSWGDQVDSTGAVIWGICQYYKETWDSEFITEMWPAVSRAGAYLADWITGDSGLARMSWDLWEERFGEHAYSFAAVYAGLKGAGQIAKSVGEDETAVKWLETAMAFRETIYEYFRDPGHNRFIRSGWIAVSWDRFEAAKHAGREVREVIGPKGYITYEVFGDDTPDASLVGLTAPFGVFMPDDPRMRETVSHLTGILTNHPTGGIKRYLNDCYIGGNPWVLTTLWLGLFEGAAGDWEAAAGRVEWALHHCTEHGFLPEQVDRETGQTAWVVPLAWSHAMFLLLVNMMSEANEISHLSGKGG